MFGIYQSSCLRWDVAATPEQVRDSLLRSEYFRQWLHPQEFSTPLPDRLQAPCTYTSRLGPIAVGHQVTRADDRTLHLILSGGVDGFQEWTWGEGWVQSRIEGISLLPLALAHTYALARLQYFLAQGLP